jgi:hypothetical protein
MSSWEYKDRARWRDLHTQNPDYYEKTRKEQMRILFGQRGRLLRARRNLSYLEERNAQLDPRDHDLEHNPAPFEKSIEKASAKLKEVEADLMRYPERYSTLTKEDVRYLLSIGDSPLFTADSFIAGAKLLPTRRALAEKSKEWKELLAAGSAEDRKTYGGVDPYRPEDQWFWEQEREKERHLVAKRRALARERRFKGTPSTAGL